MIAEVLPDVVREFEGISDARILGIEVAELRDQLSVATSQMEFEREAAKDIHRARTIAILNSPALMLVFDVNGIDEHQEQVTTPDSLAGAFLQKPREGSLPEGFSKSVSQMARIATHPDKGGDTEVAKLIGSTLEKADVDEAFAAAKALTVLDSDERITAQPATTEKLRDERYRLTLALQAAQPVYDTEEQAVEVVEREVEGAEWRTRTSAAFKCFELIIGSGEILSTFLESIARQGNQHIASYMNTYLPAIFSVQERLAKGDPLSADDIDSEAIDAIFERIWSTLGNKDENSTIPYSPPYNNWLDILLPAMEMLDPGEKPGEDYMHFQRPFQIAVQQPRNLYRERTFSRRESEENGFISKYVDSDYIRESKNY